MTESYFDIYNEYMKFLVPDCTSRILGQQSIGAPVTDILKYWQEAVARNEWGTPQIVIVYQSPRFLAFRVNNIKIGGYKTSLWFWGLTFGRNTVITKVGFWTLAIIPPFVGINTILGSEIIKPPKI
ncbi:MAG: hypothetical protein QXJ23_10605 [Thermofilum sp.]|uniref:hypothetical protein n=1 Tax=Thermofilum sp. TaxID=1961369 RepID=UPI00317A2130